MKKLLLLILVLAVNFSYATSPFLTTEKNTLPHYQKSEVFVSHLSTPDFKFALPENGKCAKYKKMKRTGLILLCVGAPVAVAGLATAVIGVTLAPNHDAFTSVGIVGGGAVLFVAGAAMTGAGTALFIIGNVKSKKYCGGTSFQLNSSPNGLGLAYNF